MHGEKCRKPAHIGLNAHLLSLSANYRGAGINRYIYSLLLALPQVDGRNRYTAFLGEERMRGQSLSALSLRFSRLPTVKPVVRILWEQLIQPFELLKENIDLLHSMAYALPLACPARSVVTVHDLSFLLFPQAFNRAKRLYLTAATRQAVRQADAVIAVSASTRRDVVRLLGVPEEKVAVVPNGIDETFRPIADRGRLEARRQERSLPEHNILSVGTLEPRKNAETLIRAYAQLKRVSAIPHKLILAGGLGWRYEGLFALVEELGLQGDVLFPGFIPYDELPLWYNVADLFVYPSLYEGFGLPPLEAMACGVPVIASHASSLPEVVGDAGFLVDPLDVEGLAEAMARVLGDGALRAEMRKRGLARAGQFSWLEAARGTARVYDRVLNPTLKLAYG
jgi:glycosyltransferase involved in cell wall biosynthesis